MKIATVTTVLCFMWSTFEGIRSERFTERRNVFNYENLAIPVFTFDKGGQLIPVILDFAKMAEVKYPKVDDRSTWSTDESQYVNTSRGFQHVHTCHGPRLLARGREHHQNLHSRLKRNWKQEPNQEESLHRHRREITNQSAFQEHIIETVMFGDYGLYARFLATNSFDPSAALLAMTLYYANVFLTVNRRYQSVTATRPSFFINLLPTQFVFVTLPQNSPWTENNRVGDRVRSETALRLFAAFASSVKQALPHDHATLITGYNLFSDNQRSNLLGVAFSFGVCSPDGSSLVEESFSEQTANTLAHEIGHSLGAPHDGDDNPCSTDDFFIMAPTSALPTTPDKGGNPWIFSSCSVLVMNTFLGTQDAECTTSLEASSRVDLTAFVQQEWGQVLNAHGQCQQKYGSLSRFCAEDYFGSVDLNFQDMCYNLKCFIPSRNTCTFIPAHDGTSCGNHQWCYQGRCVFNALAPPRLPTCPQLDDPTKVCSPGLCNPSNVEISTIFCCGTCNQLPLMSSSPSPLLPQFFPALDADGPDRKPHEPHDYNEPNEPNGLHEPREPSRSADPEEDTTSILELLDFLSAVQTKRT